MTQILAQNLVKLLDSNLTSKTFYFISKIESSTHMNGQEENSFDSSHHLENSFKNSSSLAPLDGDPNAVKDESVIGSPLKLDKIANLASLSPAHTYIAKERLATGLDISMQIPLQNARHVMQKFITTEREKTEESMLAILCNVKDVRRTLMIGVCREALENQLQFTTFLLTMKKIHMSCLEKPLIANCSCKVLFPLLLAGRI